MRIETRRECHHHLDDHTRMNHLDVFHRHCDGMTMLSMIATKDLLLDVIMKRTTTIVEMDDLHHDAGIVTMIWTQGPVGDKHLLQEKESMSLTYKLKRTVKRLFNAF
jgi:hypothetical protein